MQESRDRNWKKVAKQDKTLREAASKKIAALKVAWDEAKEAIQKVEDLNLTVSGGKSSNDVYCLLVDLENINNLVFSAFNHGGFGHDYM